MMVILVENAGARGVEAGHAGPMRAIALQRAGLRKRWLLTGPYLRRRDRTAHQFASAVPIALTIGDAKMPTMNVSARIIKSWTTRSKVTVALWRAPSAVHVDVDFAAERNPLGMAGEDDGRGGFHLVDESLFRDAGVGRQRMRRRGARIDRENEAAEKRDCVNDHLFLIA